MKDDEIITLTERNKELLRQVMTRGLAGAYYDRHYPSGVDQEVIEGYEEKEFDRISGEMLEVIADYVEVSVKHLLELISDEEHCKDWLACRRRPFDDPW